MDDRDAATSDDERKARKSRRSRRRDRGFVFPADEGGDEATYLERGNVYPRTRIRRRHRHRSRLRFTGYELLAGFTVAWIMFVSLAVLVELYSDQEWVFVHYEATPVLDHESYVIGDRAYLSDGRVVELNKSPEGANAGGDLSQMPTVALKQPAVRWKRVVAVLLGVPLLVGVGTRLYKRIRAGRQEDE